eukprot:gene6641-6867_t
MFTKHCSAEFMCTYDLHRMTLRLAQDPNSDHLGTTVWDASIVLAKFFEKNIRKGEFSRPKVTHKRAIELASGQEGHLCSCGQVRVAELDWAQPQHYQQLPGCPFDFVLAADCIYHEHLVRELYRTVLAITNERSTIVIANERRSESVQAAFLELKRKASMSRSLSYDHEFVLFLQGTFDTANSELKEDPAKMAEFVKGYASQLAAAPAPASLAPFDGSGRLHTALSVGHASKQEASGEQCQPQQTAQQAQQSCYSNVAGAPNHRAVTTGMPLPRTSSAAVAVAAGENNEDTTSAATLPMPHKRRRTADDEEVTSSPNDLVEVPSGVVVLTKSDANSKRIILPRIAVEHNLPQLAHTTAFNLSATDPHGQSWPLVIKAWANGQNPKPVYVLEQVGELLKMHRLSVGDAVALLASPDGKFYLESDAAMELPEADVLVMTYGLGGTEGEQGELLSGAFLQCPRTPGCSRPAGHQGWCLGHKGYKKRRV